MRTRAGFDRAPPPMPTVGARRSTRVFLPRAHKQTPRPPPEPVGLTRSANKRLAQHSHSHWLGWDEHAATNSSDDDDEGPKPRTPPHEPSSPERPMSPPMFAFSSACMGQVGYQGGPAGHQGGNQVYQGGNMPGGPGATHAGSSPGYQGGGTASAAKGRAGQGRQEDLYGH